MKEFFGGNVEFEFSTKEDGPMNYVGHEFYDGERRSNRNAFLKHRLHLQPTETVVPKPIHTARAEIVEVHNPIYGSITADAVITGKKGLALTMTAGDCPPVALYDPVNEVIALIHCGWKPLVAGIIENTLEKMRIGLNCHAGNIRAYVGPGLCPSCFEVGKDVWQKFNPDREPPAGRLYVSLQHEINRRLMEQGVRLTSIANTEECTKHTDEGEKYFSWRGDRSDPLCTNMAVLVMR